MTRPWRCRFKACQHLNPSRRTLLCAKCGKRRIVKKSKHVVALDAVRGDYERMLEAQGGGCAICGRKPGERRLHIDHDHKTLAVRGVLCFRCNSALRGYMDSGWLLRAFAYVRDAERRDVAA